MAEKRTEIDENELRDFIDAVDQRMRERFEIGVDDIHADGVYGGFLNEATVEEVCDWYKRKLGLIEEDDTVVSQALAHETRILRAHTD